MPRFLADAAALVLASWQGEFDASPVEAPALEAAGRPLPSPTGLAPELGIGLVAAGPRPLSAGGSLSFGLSRGVWGLGVRLTAVDFHRQPIGVGEISWNRSPVALTVRRRFKTSKGLVFGLDAGIAAAVLFSRSQRLESNHATWTTDFGPTAGVQFLFDTGGPILPFLGISTAAWIQPRLIQVTPTDTRTLPQVDSWLVLGLSWRLDAS